MASKFLASTTHTYFYNLTFAAEEDTQYVDSSQGSSVVGEMPTDVEFATESPESPDSPQSRKNEEGFVELELDDEDPIFHDGTMDDSVDVEVLMYGEKKAPIISFQPPTLQDRQALAQYCGISTPQSTVEPVFTGISNVCGDPEPTRVKAKPDGACFFHAISFLIAGRANFDLLLRCRVCNYIGDTENFHRIKPYLDQSKKIEDGKEYLTMSNMRDATEWATSVEIFAMAQMLQIDIYVWYRGKWDCFPASGDRQVRTASALYLSNARGNHFDPVTDM